MNNKKAIPEQAAIRKAIEILGAPVMSYVPAIAAREYEAMIDKAVSILLGALI